MRIVALFFALLGAAGAGYAGFADLEGGEKEPEAAEAKAKARPTRGEAQWNFLKYTLLAQVPLGVVGGVLARRGSGKLAGAILLAAYAIPVARLVVKVGMDFSDERVQRVVLFPAGLAVAGVCALFIQQETPYKRPKKKAGIDRDVDIV